MASFYSIGGGRGRLSSRWIKHWPFNLASSPAGDPEINEFAADAQVPKGKTSNQNASTYNLSQLAIYCYGKNRG